MTKEVEETETQKSEMMKLIMEQNLQIKQMEEQMEKLVKRKEDTVKMTQIPIDVVPLSTRSITIVSTLGTTTITGATKGAEQLVEVAQNLSIQTVEIKNLQDELKEFQHMKVVADNSHAAELQREKGQIEVLQKEVKDSYLGNKLGLVKEILWGEITK